MAFRRLRLRGLRGLRGQGLQQQQQRRQQMRSRLRAQYLAPFERAMPLQPIRRVMFLGAMERTRASLGRQIGWIEGILGELKSIHSSLQQSIGAQQVVDAYDTLDATSTAATSGNGSTTTTTGGSTSTAGTTTPKVSNRVLFSIFEGLHADDMTTDDYPKMDAVNDELDQRGYPNLDKNTIHAAYDRWYHEEQRELHEERDDDDHPKGKSKSHGKKATDKALFAVFEDMEHHHKKKDFTGNGKYPSVDAVNERLEDKGFAHVDRPTLREAYGDWTKEEEEEEGEEGESHLKSPTNEALDKAFEKLKKGDFTDEDEPGRRYPLVKRVTEELKKLGYSHATRTQVHKEYSNWAGKEEDEGDHVPGMKPVTVRALHEVFEAIKLPKDKKYPLASAVNDKLAEMGYEHISADEMHERYDAWKK